MQNFIIVFQLFIIILLVLYIVLKLNWFFLKRAYYKHFPKAKQGVDKPYQKFKFFDKAPIVADPFIKNFEEIIEDIKLSTGKTIQPVKSSKVPDNVVCPYCHAPHNYIYDNNGGKGQFLCKVCSHTFHVKHKYIDSPLLCPYCNGILQLAKDRNNFFVYKCWSYKCPCYLQNLKSLSSEERKKYKSNPGDFALHYIYRVPKFDFKNLFERNSNKPINNIGSIRCSYFTLGLILTYKYNYGLSARKIASLLFDVHQIKVSHTTIISYCQIVAPIVKFFLDNFKYDTSGKYCGDETYSKVKGKWIYVIFFFDAVKKIILSYDVFEKRNSEAACSAIADLFSKVYHFCKDILIVTDANPIYNVAHLLFKQHDMPFNLVQVVGLSNKDEVSKEYRPFKQMIERLNRTFKEIYKPTCGYASLQGAKTDAILFTACYNFLRPNVALNYEVPVKVDKILSAQNMPLKWCQLISCAMSMIENS